MKRTFSQYCENTTAPRCETNSAGALLDIIILVMFFASAFRWIAEQFFEAGISACVKAGGEG